MRDGTDGQNIGIEVYDLGELGESEHMEFCESGSEIRSSCKRGLVSTSCEWFDINWVDAEDDAPTTSVLERSDGLS